MEFIIGCLLAHATNWVQRLTCVCALGPEVWLKTISEHRTINVSSGCQLGTEVSVSVCVSAMHA